VNIHTPRVVAEVEDDVEAAEGDDAAEGEEATEE